MPEHPPRRVTRRDFMLATAGTGFAAAVVSAGWPGAGPADAAAGAPAAAGTGTTPEQGRAGQRAAGLRRVQHPVPAAGQRDALCGQLLRLSGGLGPVRLPRRQRPLLSGGRRLQRGRRRHHGRGRAAGPGHRGPVQPAVYRRLPAERRRTLSPGGRTPNIQPVWLEQTLARARADSGIDWIVVQMHQSALSSSTDNGCDAVDPGQRGGDTTMTVTYYQAPTQTSGSPEYSVLETFQLTRPRSDRPRTVSTGAGRAATVTAR